MKFGIGLAPFDRWASYDEMADAVAAAEKAGFDYVTLRDHILIPEGPEQPRSGVVFPDVIPLVAFLAARTSRIQFVFAALVVPVRETITLTAVCRCLLTELVLHRLEGSDRPAEPPRGSWRARPPG